MNKILHAYRRPLLIATAALAIYAVLGFFLAPWLVKKNAISVVDETLNAELRLQKVAINPFVLSLRVDGVELDDPAGAPLVRVQQVFVNVQLSSLFRRALTFDEIRVDEPHVFLSRDNQGVLNVASLTTGNEAEPANDSEASSMFPILVYNFAINSSALNWNDQVPVDPVDTRFGPVNIAIANLNTLPNRPGQQEVVITTETSGTLSWSGSLQLNPLQSEGRASIKGSHFPLIFAYLRNQIGFDAVNGAADIDLDYRVASQPDGAIEASIDNLNVQFNDILVRTFTAASTADDAVVDRDVLALPRLRLSGGALRWPQQTVSFKALEVDDASLSVFRDAEGSLNIIPPSQVAATEPALTEDVVPEDDGTDWTFSMEKLNVNRMAMQLEDESVQPTANVGISELNLEITDINNAPDSQLPTKLDVALASGGTASVNGVIGILPELLVNVDVDIDNLALAATNPYIKPLADAQLESGALNLAAKVQVSSADALQAQGDLSIVDFLITETDEDTRLGGWSSFDINRFNFSSDGRTLQIAEIALQQPYGNIRIAADGSTNLGRIKKTDGDVEEPSSRSDDPAAKTGGVDSGAALDVTIGEVTIADAAVDFEDLALPIPFSAKIAGLNGSMTTIATSSSEPSTVALEGTVDEFGFVRVSGFVTPLDISRNTDINVAFQNVTMPKLSSYTIPFAGREIASGKLDLDLGYTVTDSELAGENKIVLRDLKLGEKVEHPGAMNLPLGLAIALLKDSDGKIDIDLPVRGNVDDPNFQYGQVAQKALSTLILKIVASPFSLLGNLLGVEPNELEYVEFLPGRAKLTPPEVERAASLAEALNLRPELVLELRGVIDRDVDGQVLKAQKVDALLDARLAASEDMDAAKLANRKTSILEELFAANSSAADPSTQLDALRLRFTTAATDSQDATFDALAYRAELRRQVAEQQKLTEAELTALANDRSSNTRDAIVQVDPGLQSRIIVGDLQPVDATRDDVVRMKVTLSTGAGR